MREQFAQLRRVQEARRTLVANLSHDLRTPLTSILGYAETLQQSGHVDKRNVNRYATIIAQRSRYMDRLLDHLFEASLLDRPRNGLETKRCNLCRLVEQVVVEYAMVFEERGVRPELVLPEQPVWLEVNDQAIQQVFRNLIDNALEYGSDGGYLGVRVNEAPDAVLIAVADRGKGIPPEEQSRIFEPFYRVDKARRSGNIGVGLALSREIVFMHHGRIWVESKPYESTVFTVALPKNGIDRSASS